MQWTKKVDKKVVLIINTQLALHYSNYKHTNWAQSWKNCQVGNIPSTFLILATPLHLTVLFRLEKLLTIGVSNLCVYHFQY